MELPTNITSTNLADGDTAIRFLHEQEAIRRARSRRRWIAAGATLAGLFVLMVGCGVAVGAAASGGSSTSTTATPATVPAPIVYAPSTPDLSGEATAPPAATTAPVTGPPAPSTELPRTWIDVGMWHAPDEIEAGTYRTTGRAAGETYKCMITVAGANGDVADYQSAEAGPLRITVADGQTVTVEGCAPLTKVA